MIEINLFKQSIIQVINAPLFWGSMGFTVAIAMFVGAIIYDGRLNQAKKGIFSILSYAFMIFWVTIIRVNDILSSVGKETLKKMPNYANAYNGISTIIIITLFWLMGILLGVTVFKTRTIKLKKTLKKVQKRIKNLKV